MVQSEHGRHLIKTALSVRIGRPQMTRTDWKAGIETLKFIRTIVGSLLIATFIVGSIVQPSLASADPVTDRDSRDSAASAAEGARPQATPRRKKADRSKVAYIVTDGTPP
jgi:hypothetical protein